MTALQKQARIAGLLYLGQGLFAPVNLMYVLPRLIVRGDATATAANITGSPQLLRIGIATEMIGQGLTVFIAWALYQLLKDVDRKLALLMVMLALVSASVTFANTFHEIGAMIVLSGAKFLAVFAKTQLDALAYLFLRLHGLGVQAVSIFWGLWLFPFGLLVYRSRFIPKIFGVLLLVNGIAYLIACFGTFLLPPDYRFITQWMLLPEAIGEPLIMLWLVIKGARNLEVTA